MSVRDEARPPKGADSAHAPRWHLRPWKPQHQFDLTRRADHVVYLSRWWLVKTPWGGLALHRMRAPDARATLHDHPFSFVSLVLRGGYVERRLDPRTMSIDERRVVRRWNVARARVDAHSIRELLRVPTWTLLLIGPHHAKWGFLDRLGPRGEWLWREHDAFDSGSYVPLPDGTS